MYYGPSGYSNNTNESHPDLNKEDKVKNEKVDSQDIAPSYLKDPEFNFYKASFEVQQRVMDTISLKELIKQEELAVQV